MTPQGKLFRYEKLIIYTDGGARGNPGPAASAYVIWDSIPGGATTLVAQRGEYLGETTNNIAEYTAIILALKKAKALLGKQRAKTVEVEMRMDSELAQRQLSGRYKIENAGIQPLFLQVWNLRLDFKSVTFTHVRREQNREADAIVNEILDKHS